MQRVGTDVEATGLYPYGTYEDWGFYPARPFAWTFVDEKTREATYVSAEVDPFTREVLPLSKGDVRVIRDVYEDPKIVKIFHNAPYDIRINKYAGYPIKGRVEDSMWAAHVTSGGSEMSYELKRLCDRYTGLDTGDESALKTRVNEGRRYGKAMEWCLATKPFFGKEPWKADMWLPYEDLPDLVQTYCCLDGLRTLMLLWACEDMLDQHPGMRETYEREMRLRPVTMRIEERGVRVHRNDIRRLTKYYRRYIAKQKHNAAEDGYPDINFRSSKQKVKAFFIDKGYQPKAFNPPPKKLKDREFCREHGWPGNPKCSADVLNELYAEHDDALAKAIMEAGVGSHTISNFLAPAEMYSYVPEGESEHILHTSLKQVGPVTGRMAASDPNMMNVASETTGRNFADIGPRAREIFGPREGYLWLLPDYSQIEVWIFGFHSEDEEMIEALLSGEDYHGRISRQVWGHEPDFLERKSYYRKRAKLIMFCKLYGGGVKKVALLLREPVEVAAKFVRDFDKRLPGIERYMKRMINRCRRSPFMQNPFGRAYYVEQRFAYRITNYLTQGTAADVFKEALIEVDDLFQNGPWPDCHIVLPYHDEIICEIPEDVYCQELCDDIVERMQIPSERAGIPVPLPVGMKVSRVRWSTTRKVRLAA